MEFIWNGQTEKIVYNSYEESASGDGSIRFTDIRVKPEQKEDSGILGVGVKKKNGETQEAVAGAVFGLYTKDAVYCTDGTMLLEAGSLPAVSEPTDAEGFTGFSVDVPLRDESWSEGAACNSGRYVIREQQSPEGYLLNPQETEVVFLYEDPEPEWVFVSGECENIESEFVVSKREIAGSEELSGCTLQILEVTGVDEEGKYMAEQILSWESTDTPEVIRGLKLGEEVIDGEVKPLYILRELRPADGYVTAEDIFFYLKQEEDKETGELLPATIVYQLKEDGNGNQIGEIVTDGILVMEDDFTKGLISKTDLATGEPVVGAELMITDAEGNVAAQWITTKEPYYIEKLVPGDYVLTERKTPEGSDYSVAESMAFRVEDSGEIWHIEMQDDHIRFLIGKTDKDTGKNVAGARLRLEYLPGVTEEETGKNTPVVICEFVSEEKDRLFEHVLPGVYRLTELEAPEGYRLAEPILFTVTNDWQTQRFVLENERKPREVPPIPEETPPKQTEGEETGDINAVIFDVTLAAIALAALILTVETRVLKWYRKERQE